jgi:transcriptional regulator with XRE-family HTH domain
MASAFNSTSFNLQISLGDCKRCYAIREDPTMIVGARLKALREQKKISQIAIEEQTGLPRGYIRSLENGRTIPDLKTLEMFAAVLQVPLYRLFFDDGCPPKLANVTRRKSADDLACDCKDKSIGLLEELRHIFGHTKVGKRI